MKVMIFLVLIFFNYFGNSYSTEISKYVSGRVIDERSFPVPFVKVLINGAEVSTDNFGKFRMLNVRFPYDAVVAVRSTSTAVIYKNLNIENPDLILFGNLNSIYSYRAVVNLNFPEIPSGSSAKIKFISPDVFYCEDAEAFTGEKSKTIIVYWPLSQKTINGKVIYIQKNNSLYENYRENAISIFQNTIPFETTFGKNITEIAHTSNLTVYFPFDDYTVKGYSVYADFLAYNRNSEILLTKQEGNILKTKSIIPSLLPVSYRLKINGFAKYKDGSGFISTAYSKPGATINLSTENPPELKTPSDKFMGAAGNTEFSYSSGSGTGIYVVHYQSFYPDMDFYIVTGERSAYLNYLSRDEFKKVNSVDFKWDVKKYLTYFSVDDFVKPNEFKNDIGYRAILYSGERTFKTGYF